MECVELAQKIQTPLNVGQYQKVIRTSGYVDSTEETDSEAGLLLPRAGMGKGGGRGS